MIGQLEQGAQVISTNPHRPEPKDQATAQSESPTPQPPSTLGPPPSLKRQLRLKLRSKRFWLRLIISLVSLVTIPWGAWNAYDTLKVRANQPAAENYNLDPDHLGPEMVYLSGGTLMMGSRGDEIGRVDDEGPQHSVQIAPFAIGRYEVTFEEYAVFAKSTGKPLPEDDSWGLGKRPVINVSWDDAQAYAAWLSKKTGKPYRLPTEAEWEYAARAGTTTAYFWGDDAKQACLYANVYESRFACENGYSGQTAPVGSFRANAFGLQDMLGNVWEWVADCYHDNYQGAPTDGRSWEDKVACQSGRRVLRGGSWDLNPPFVRAAFRVRGGPDDRYSYLGFRLARTL